MFFASFILLRQKNHIFQQKTVLVSATGHVIEEICAGSGIKNSGRSATNHERLEYTSHQFNNKVRRYVNFKILMEMIDCVLVFF